QSSGYVVRSQLFGFPIAIVADNGFPIAIVADNAGLNRINVRYPAPHPRHKPPSSGHRSVPASRASVLPKHDSANSPQRPIHFQPLSAADAPGPVAQDERGSLVPLWVQVEQGRRYAPIRSSRARGASLSMIAASSRVIIRAS